MTTNSQATMSLITLENQIINTISWTLNVAPHRLQAYTHFVDDLHLDDIDMTLLIVSLEYQLNLYLTSEEVAAVETMADLNKYFKLQLPVAA